jgi:hypothetical protein
LPNGLSIAEEGGQIREALALDPGASHLVRLMGRSRFIERRIQASATDQMYGVGQLAGGMQQL